MNHVFTYGSLMFDEVWSRVVRGRYESEAGKLFGFKRKCIRHEHYPAVIPGPVSASVGGIIYLNVDAADLNRLDAFEGSLYRRQAVQIHTDNNIFQAHAYILAPSYRHIITDDDWDPKRFSEDGINAFLSTYLGFDR